MPASTTGPVHTATASAPVAVALTRIPGLSSGWRSAAGALRMHRAARELLGELAELLAKDTGVELPPRGDAWPQHPSGAPAPALASDGQPWHWAVSHSRGLVAAALCRSGPLGLDLEATDRSPSQNIAERLAQLGVPAAQLATADGCRQAWTRSEAVLKATGTGLGGLSKLRHLASPRTDDPVARLEFEGRPFAARTLHHTCEGETSPAIGACLTVAHAGTCPPHIEFLPR